jgi:uncharacterized membrane protein
MRIFGNVIMKENALKKFSIAIAILGLLDAAYLTFEKITSNQALCLPGLGDCSTVNNSPYSLVFGIPVASLGFVAYLIILFLLKNEDRFPTWKFTILQATFGIALSGTIFSIYLTYLEIAVIKAVCPFCVISAIAMIILFVCTLLRLVQNQSEFKSQLEDENG